jgi:hypothetical protein
MYRAHRSHVDMVVKNKIKRSDKIESNKKVYINRTGIDIYNK